MTTQQLAEKEKKIADLEGKVKSRAPVDGDVGEKVMFRSFLPTLDSPVILLDMSCSRRHLLHKLDSKSTLVAFQSVSSSIFLREVVPPSKLTVYDSKVKA